jgi:hypothetical protein
MTPSNSKLFLYGGALITKTIWAITEYHFSAIADPLLSRSNLPHVQEPK